MLEAELSKICKQLFEYSGLVFWRVSNGGVIHKIGPRTIMKKSEIAGFPDFAGVTPLGVFFALELKGAKGVLAAHQIEWLSKLEDTHAITGVARTPDEIRNFIKLCGGLVKQTV